MRLIRIVACVSLMMIVPGTARANLWDWIQEMSGPGPFNGRGAVLATVCSQSKSSTPGGWADRLSTLVSNNRPVAEDWRGDKTPCWFFDIRHLAYDGSGNFPAAVNLTAHDFGVTWQLLRYRAVEIGIGGGIAHFSGVNDVTANRFTVTIPRVEVAPVAIVPALLGNPIARNPWLRLLKYHVGYLWVPGTLKAEDFGVARGTGPGQSTFSRQGEYLYSRGFFIDLGELFRHQ